jgi:hypothetical protein
VPSKGDTDWICSYTVLRYLVDAKRDVSVPLGITLWNSEHGRLWIRLPQEGESVDGASTRQARGYAALVRDKILGWHRLGELPYQTEALEPLSDAWWEQVRRLLQWRVRLGPIRSVTCRDPEQEIERLYETWVQPRPAVPEEISARAPEDGRKMEVLAAD